MVLGDSITYAGEWVEFFEAGLRQVQRDHRPEILNLGLPSETASGLSEEGHAGGAFPRPDVNERLGRVLSRLKPDLILACYGMNDGIYFPSMNRAFPSSAMACGDCTRSLLTQGFGLSTSPRRCLIPSR